jgi:hypothetical protein
MSQVRHRQFVIAAGALAALTLRAFAQRIILLLDEIQSADITTLQGIADALSMHGIQRSRNASWHLSTVRNLLVRGAL